MKNIKKTLLLTLVLSLSFNSYTSIAKAESIESNIQSAQSYYSNKNYDDALKLLKDIISKDNQESRAYYLLGKIYYEQQNYDEAIKYFNLYSSTDPSKSNYTSNIINKIKQAQMKPKSPPILSTEISFQENSGTGYLNAKDTGYIVVKVKNDGKDSAKNLSLKISLENEINGLIYNNVYKISKIDSGKEDEIKIPIKAGDDIKDDEATFKIDVTEPFYGADADSQTLILKTKAFKAPKLVITSFAVKDGGFGTTIKKGTEAQIEAVVKNKGEGKALNAQVFVKSGNSDLNFTSDNNFDLDSLDVGESKKISFSVFVAKNSSLSDLDLSVDLKNKYDKYNSSEKMKFALEGSKPKENKVVIAPVNTSSTTKTIVNESNDISLLSDVDVNIPKTNKENKFGVAIIIGNKNYKNQDIAPVDFAHNDAFAIKEYVKNVLGFDEKNIITLQDATQADFITYFGSKDLKKDEPSDGALAQKVKDKSDVFVYYSGHGAPDVKDESGKTAYFVPSDASPNLIKSLGYPLNSFYDNLNKLRAKSVTVVIDSCFSGGSEKGMLVKNASPIFIDIKKQYDFGNMDVFTSASGKQISSWYEDKSHSLFTYYFLKAMQLGKKEDEDGDKADSNSDGTLTINEIHNYVNMKVKSIAVSKNRTQTTEVFTLDKNKAFVKY